eukprot:Gb_26839 [translate_table: standard]
MYFPLHLSFHVSSGLVIPCSLHLDIAPILPQTSYVFMEIQLREYAIAASFWLVSFSMECCTFSLLVGHHVIVPQHVGGWTGPFGESIISVGFGFLVGLQPLTPSIFQFSFYPPSQRLPYLFTRVAFLHPWRVISPFHPLHFTHLLLQIIATAVAGCYGPFGTGFGFFTEDMRSQPGRQMLWGKTPPLILLADFGY